MPDRITPYREGGNMVLVPREPTPEMCQSAHSALFKWRETQGDPQQDPSNMEKHAIRYRAMIEAALANQPGET